MFQDLEKQLSVFNVTLYVFQGLEKQLSVFNITLARQTAELEVMRHLLPLTSLPGYWLCLQHLVSSPLGLLTSLWPLNYMLTSLTPPFVQVCLHTNGICFQFYSCSISMLFLHICKLDAEFFLLLVILSISISNGCELIHRKLG